MDTKPIGVEDVRQRAALAGVKLDERRMEEVAAAMEQALAPLRRLQPEQTRLIEPVVRFSAAWRE